MTRTWGRASKSVSDNGGLWKLWNPYIFSRGCSFDLRRNSENHSTGWTSVRSPVSLLEAVHDPWVAALWEKPAKSVRHSTSLRAEILPLKSDERRIEPGYFHILRGEMEEILQFGGNHLRSAVLFSMLWIIFYSKQLSLCMCLSPYSSSDTQQQQQSSQLIGYAHSRTTLKIKFK